MHKVQVVYDTRQLKGGLAGFLAQLLSASTHRPPLTA
jgi:hypothetical protein